MKIIIIIFFWLNLINNQDISTLDKQLNKNIKCNYCRCYEVKCTRFEMPGPNCQDSYKGSCNIQSNIVEENNCEKLCGCCMENKCYESNSYNCIMFKFFEISSVFFMLMITLNLFILNRLYNFFFNLNDKRQEKLNIKSINDTNKTDYKFNKIYIKYSGSIIIERNQDTLFNINAQKMKNITKLFNKFKDIKFIGYKNIVFYIALVIVYFLIDLIHIFFIFYIPKYPLIYGKICWVIYLLSIIFYVFVIFSYTNYFKNYSIEANKIIKKFEKYNYCNVIINNKLNIIEFIFRDDDLVKINDSYAEESNKSNFYVESNIDSERRNFF